MELLYIIFFVFWGFFVCFCFVFGIFFLSEFDVVQLDLYKHQLIIIRIIIRCSKTCTNMFFFFLQSKDPKVYRSGFFNKGNHCDIKVGRLRKPGVQKISSSKTQTPFLFFFGVAQNCLLFFMQSCSLYIMHMGCDNMIDIVKLFLAIPSPIQGASYAIFEIKSLKYFLLQFISSF